MHFKSDKIRQVWAGGFLYNPVERCVLLHYRDANTRYNPNKWALFGGLCLPGELPIDGFRRELQEEIGLAVTADEVVELRTHYYQKLRTYRYVYYVRSSASLNELTLGEGAGFSWIPIDELVHYQLSLLSKSDMAYFLHVVDTHRSNGFSQSLAA